MSFPSKADLERTGFLPALPRNLALLLPSPAAPQPLTIADLELPSTSVALLITTFARGTLPEPTFNHSMRVYLLGLAILRQHLPSVTFTTEAFYVLSLLHDLGTAIADSPLSFEYAGGIKAREQLLASGADAVLADSVCEAIIRHQDVFLGVEGGDGGGKLTALTAVVHLSTLLDNIGKNAELVHRGTIDDVVAAWPRLGWSGCFCDVIASEGERKPWCHSTTIGIERFKEDVKGNALMNAYEV